MTPSHLYARPTPCSTCSMLTPKETSVAVHGFDSMQTRIRGICNQRKCMGLFSLTLLALLYLTLQIHMSYDGPVCYPKVKPMKVTTVPKSKHEEVVQRTALGMVPNCSHWWCEALFDDQEKETIPAAYNLMLPYFIKEIRKHKMLLEKLEGNIGEEWRQSLAYSRLANNKFVKTICETGFNAGHSALIWLTSNPHAHVYFFDLGYHSYTRGMAKFFQNEFPGRTTFIWGDSRKTIPQFTRDNPTVMCDLIHVDGGHAYEVAKADLHNIRAHAKKEGHILMLDDHPAVSQPGVGVAWQEQLQLGQVEEYWGCQFMSYKKKGFTVAKFANLCQNDKPTL